MYRLIHLQIHRNSGGTTIIVEALRDADVDIEDTFNGSWDLDDLAGLKQTPKFIYVIELKYDATPEQALRQIEEKGYARKFAVDSRRLFKIGVNFSSEKRRIVGWRFAE